ncbi:hypothetical protein T02_14404 [Trichinella nativa]|uniref:Uncharacterized protein n=1 Tax=Trichinella nativa TaxID=6335 RepID=A0A0V1LGR7_9BILA|nr:hypothetical protein T02_14404 [Trichinella nativa]
MHCECQWKRYPKYWHTSILQLNVCSFLASRNTSFLVPVSPSTVTIVSPLRFTSCPVKLRNITGTLFSFRLPMLFQHSGVTMVTAAPVFSSIRVDLPLILTVTSTLCARSLTA